MHVDGKGIIHPGIETELHQQTPESGFNWIHLQADTDDAFDTMQSLGLSEPIIDSLSALETRPRALLVNDGIQVYLRGINRNPDADPEDMVSLRIWFNEHTVVSARRKNRNLLSVLDTKAVLTSGHGPRSATDLVLELIKRMTDRISEVVDDLDDRLTEFETEQGMNSTDRFKLSLIRRQAAAIRRYLAPQRDALETLYRINKHFSPSQGHDLRDLTDRMARYVEDLDLAKERAMVLQDELRNRVAEMQGMRMYVLSLVTAIFLPLSFLTGIFGMNVAGLPGTENPEAFNYLAMGMLGLALFMLIGMIWKKWF